MASLHLLAGLILVLVSVSSAKPNLGVYYESLCPYSRQFIREEVWPAYQVLADYFDVYFVAYGNAKTTGSLESGFSIECQQPLDQNKQEQIVLMSLDLTMHQSRLVQ